jgi:hypothetical protein
VTSHFRTSLAGAAATTVFYALSKPATGERVQWTDSLLLAIDAATWPIRAVILAAAVVMRASRWGSRP